MKALDHLLLPLRLVKALIWMARVERWERLLREVHPESERARRLEWKIVGARLKIARYVNRKRIGLDLWGG